MSFSYKKKKSKCIDNFKEYPLLINNSKGYICVYLVTRKFINRLCNNNLSLNPNLSFYLYLSSYITFHPVSKFQKESGEGGPKMAEE